MESTSSLAMLYDDDLMFVVDKGASMGTLLTLMIFVSFVLVYSLGIL